MVPPLFSAIRRGPPATADDAVDAVTVDEGWRAARAIADARRYKLDDLVEGLPRQRLVGRGLPHEVEERVLGPGLARRFRNDLLGEHVEGRHGHGDAIEAPRAYGSHQGGAFEQLVPARREEAAMRTQPQCVARAADPLQEGGDAARRADLADEIDRTDIDAQLE